MMTGTVGDSSDNTRAAQQERPKSLRNEFEGTFKWLPIHARTPTVISGCISLMYLCFWAAPRHAADNGAPILNGIWFGLGRFTKRALSGPRIGGIAGLRRECSQRAEINCSCLKTGCCARCATAGLRQQRAGRRDQDAARNKSKSRLTCHAVANAQ
jgi:hypothetical protein